MMPAVFTWEIESMCMCVCIQVYVCMYLCVRTSLYPLGYSYDNAYGQYKH